MPSRGGVLRLRPAGGEGCLELLVEIDTVSDENDAWIDDFRVERQSPCQHDHRERLTGPLRVPDDAALAAAFGIPLLHFGEDILDREELLIAGNLLDAEVKQREA